MLNVETQWGLRPWTTDKSPCICSIVNYELMSFKLGDTIFISYCQRDRQREQMEILFSLYNTFCLTRRLSHIWL